MKILENGEKTRFLWLELAYHCDYDPIICMEVFKVCKPRSQLGYFPEVVQRNKVKLQTYKLNFKLQKTSCYCITTIAEKSKVERQQHRAVCTDSNTIQLFCLPVEQLFFSNKFVSTASA